MTDRLNARTCVLFLIFVVLGVYYPAIFSPANSVDDPGTINYLFNANNFNLRGIFTPGETYFRPLLLVSFLADKYVWGLQESFMHLENILFHLLNVLLLFAIGRNCSSAEGARSPILPLTAALLFALHPINAEAVNWISGRTDLLSCFFVLLSALLLLRRSVSLTSTALAVLCLLLACLAKETAIFFLPAALLVPFFRDPPVGVERRGVCEVALQNWPHFLAFSGAGAGFLLFRSLASHHGDQGVALVVSHVAGPQRSNLAHTLWMVLKSAGFYLKKLFVPFPLNFGIYHVSDLYFPIGICLCLLLVWLLTRRTLAAFFFLCAASVAGSALLIPLLNMTWTPLAERYMYIPSAFFSLGVAFSVLRWGQRARFQKVVTALAVAVLIIACYGTASRTMLWQDNLALFEDTLKKSPGFVPAQNEIAVALYERGQTQKSIEMRNSMQLTPGLVNPQYGVLAKATALGQSDDLDGAEAMLNQGLKNPGKSEVQMCGMLLKVYELKVTKKISTRAEVYRGSIHLLSRLYELTGDPFYQYRLGIVHMTHKERGLARVCFALAATRAPADSFYRQPALKLSQKMTDPL